MATKINLPGWGSNLIIIIIILIFSFLFYSVPPSPNPPPPLSHLNFLRPCTPTPACSGMYPALPPAPSERLTRSDGRLGIGHITLITSPSLRPARHLAAQIAHAPRRRGTTSTIPPGTALRPKARSIRATQH